MSPLFFCLFIFLFLVKLITASSNNGDSFIYNGFGIGNLSLDGMPTIRPSGLLQLTNTTDHMRAHAFHPTPIHFNATSSSKPLSFSTTFVFALVSDFSYIGGNGIAFVISPTTDFSTATTASQYLGLLNETDNGNLTNHIFAIELDTTQNPEFDDIDGNHVGIDIDSLKSYNSSTAGYYDDRSGSFQNLTLISGQPMQVWVDYDGEGMQLSVTLSPVQMPKPSIPLLSSKINLTGLMDDSSMYVGFSSATGSHPTYQYYILGWSFNLNGVADPLDYAKLPSLPGGGKSKGNSKVFAIWVSLVLTILLVVLVAATLLVVRMRRKSYVELLEDWELEYGPHRFSYRDLYQATKGFKEKELLGTGGFGSVYRGVLPKTKMQVAVKKISHESKQGIKEFVAEVVSIGQLRHRNIVQLLGYCRRQEVLLLVYDYMPNGSLDKYLFDHTKPTLNWTQRFRIIKGVASGLLYLHEYWQKVVIHRDIKASNVMLDSEMDGKLGDFGLARLYDHEGSDPKTTRVVGTLGYVAPDLAKTGKATTKTDVFAFGAFLLEVACGRRPVDSHAKGDDLILMDLVLETWQKGNVLEARDSRLGEDYNADEVELVLKLGLLCSNPNPGDRPTMRQVAQILERDADLPEFPPSYKTYTTLLLFKNEGFDGHAESFSSSVASMSFISSGR